MAQISTASTGCVVIRNRNRTDILQIRKTSFLVYTPCTLRNAKKPRTYMVAFNPYNIFQYSSAHLTLIMLYNIMDMH